jgi:hypothetical protein
MKVTAITGSSWTVVRGDGRTGAASHFAVRGDGSITKVASNPLPLDGTLPVSGPADGGAQMQMCIKSESWQAVGENYCSGSSGPLCSLIEVTTTVFDIGDGLMIR